MAHASQHRAIITGAVLGALAAALVMAATACGGVQSGTGTGTGTITGGSPVPVPTGMSAVQTRLPENTLKIAEPLPGTVITGSVTVKGEGRAFENTILVAVVAGGKTVGKDIVTTTAEAGQTGYFTITVPVTPVARSTDGYVTIYTESAKDGSIDQQASVNVRFEPPGTTAPAP
jgi:hypothetical protein